MNDDAQTKPRRRGREKTQTRPPAHKSDHRRVVNTLPHARVFSDDQVAAIHNAALRVLEELGVRVLLDEGREIFKKAGARIDDDFMVRVDRGLIEEARQKAPPVFEVSGRAPERSFTMGENSLVLAPGAGCPNITDMDRGRRPGTLADFVETIKLHQSFDIIHKLGASIEPQDVPLHLRHYATMRAQTELSDKVPFFFARSQGQSLDGFEITRLAHGMDEDTFRRTPTMMTVINTNSPRQLDIPMTQGIIDFARWGQPLIITPFCLSGAMAPVTVAGALTLSHAEALLGITLAQLVNPGTPVVYGAFSSNVDMKSGAPAFGTPEHVKTNFGAGQLARYVNLPWRSGGGTASNAPDVQADYETQFSLWGAVLGGANFILHAAGWLEGGLTFSYEKFITDVETLQVFSETMLTVPCGDDDIGFSAIAEVKPGGHFFAAEHTMERYASQFYEPLVSDWSNFGQWTEAGAKTATQRANGIWKQTLRDFEPPPLDPARLEAIDAFIAKRTEEGGALPVS
ncbi:MAG: trimethylamine methyltransferase family protein [Rhodospirillales bacterium]